jgi:hypothetical protein
LICQKWLIFNLWPFGRHLGTNNEWYVNVNIPHETFYILNHWNITDGFEIIASVYKILSKFNHSRLNSFILHEWHMSLSIDQLYYVSIHMLSLRAIFWTLYKELREPAASFSLWNSMRKVAADHILKFLLKS